MSKQHIVKVMILVDDIWRLANMIAECPNTNDIGGIQAELNGMIFTVKSGYWYNIGNGLTEEQMHNITIQNNIEQLFQIANRKVNHKKTQERLAEQQRLVEQQAANPQPEQRAVVQANLNEDDGDYFSDIDNFCYECDCEACQRARGEI